MAKVRGARNNTHNRKIERKHCRLEVRRNFYSQRVIEKWNSLTLDEVNSKKTSEFKERYDAKEAERMKNEESNIYVRA